MSSVSAAIVAASPLAKVHCGESMPRSRAYSFIRAGVSFAVSKPKVSTAKPSSPTTEAAIFAMRARWLVVVGQML